MRNRLSIYKSVALLPVTFLATYPPDIEAQMLHCSARHPMDYYLVVLERPVSARALTEQQEADLQEAHMANIRRLALQRSLVLAGPFVGDTPLRGIFVLKASSPAQARKLVSTDPAVKAGRLTGTVHGPWLIDPKSIHEAAVDPNHLQQYVLVFFFRTEKWLSADPPPSEWMKRHSTFLKQMKDRGLVALEGLFAPADERDLIGLAILRAEPEQMARSLEDDPVVSAGLLRVELHPWLTSKGRLDPGRPVP